MADNLHSSQETSNRNAALERLRVFIGEWAIEVSSMSFNSDPSAVERGRATFDWLEGGAFVIQLSEISTSADFPRSIAIIAPDDAAETYGMLYFDSRGVARMYETSFEGGVWKLERTKEDFSPYEFAQRYTGTFSKDGKRIDGTWEIASDKKTWKKDFDLNYIRVA